MLPAELHLFYIAVFTRSIPHYEAGLRYHSPFHFHPQTSEQGRQNFELSQKMLSQGAPRMGTEYRHMSTGSLNIPPPTALNGAGPPPPPVGGIGRFDGPRSPPGRQSEIYSTMKKGFTDCYRYLTCALQILSARCMSGWLCLSFQS